MKETRSTPWGALVVTTLAATLLSGCGGSSTGTAAGGTGTPGSNATGESNSAKGKKIILDTLFRAPLAQAQAAGAKQAASAVGADINWVGPPSPDPPTAIKALQDAAAAGADGAVVAAFPGDLFRVPINQTGIPVVTLDIYSPGSKAATHFGPDKYALGAALAKEFLKKLPADSSGTVVGGICVPGLPSLEQPQKGFADTLKQQRPSVKFIGDVFVDPDPTKNFGSWQRIVAQHPDAVGFVGQCDQDIPNLIKLKRDSKAKYLIGDTSGDNADTIAAVKDGTVAALVSQNGWAEGYMSTSLLLAHLTRKLTLPSGWIDTGFTVIDQATADQALARFKDPSSNLPVFKAQIDKMLGDPGAIAKPYDQCRGCGTS